jgi:hypothetical protein
VPRSAHVRACGGLQIFLPRPRAGWAASVDRPPRATNLFAWDLLVRDKRCSKSVLQPMLTNLKDTLTRRFMISNLI